MVILELKYLTNLRINSDSNKGLKLNITNSTTNGINTELNDEIYYHKNNLALLLILMIAFFILSYYLHYVSKFSIKKAKSTNSESNITFLKYSNIQNLSIANFSKIINNFSQSIKYNLHSDVLQ